MVQALLTDALPRREQLRGVAGTPWQDTIFLDYKFDLGQFKRDLGPLVWVVWRLRTLVTFGIIEFCHSTVLLNGVTSKNVPLVIFLLTDLCSSDSGVSIARFELGRVLLGSAWAGDDALLLRNSVLQKFY